MLRVELSPYLLTRRSARGAASYCFPAAGLAWLLAQAATGETRPRLRTVERYAVDGVSEEALPCVATGWSLEANEVAKPADAKALRWEGPRPCGAADARHVRLGWRHEFEGVGEREDAPGTPENANVER